MIFCLPYRVFNFVFSCSHVLTFHAQILAKAARELLRGSFTTINDDAANLSDTLRHMVGCTDAIK